MEGLTMENMNQTEVKTEQTPMNNAQNAAQAPVAQLKTDRGLLNLSSCPLLPWEFTALL